MGTGRVAQPPLQPAGQAPLGHTALPRPPAPCPPAGLPWAACQACTVPSCGQRTDLGCSQAASCPLSPPPTPLPGAGWGLQPADTAASHSSGSWISRPHRLSPPSPCRVAPQPGNWAGLEKGTDPGSSASGSELPCGAGASPASTASSCLCARPSCGSLGLMWGVGSPHLAGPQVPQLLPAAFPLAGAVQVTLGQDHVRVSSHSLRLVLATGLQAGPWSPGVCAVRRGAGARRAGGAARSAGAHRPPLPCQMPVCSYFLKGICSNSNCPYSHVYVSRKAEVCTDFLKGYCPLGAKVSVQAGSTQHGPAAPRRLRWHGALGIGVARGHSRRPSPHLSGRGWPRRVFPTAEQRAPSCPWWPATPDPTRACVDSGAHRMGLPGTPRGQLLTYPGACCHLVPSTCEWPPCLRGLHLDWGAPGDVEDTDPAPQMPGALGLGPGQGEETCLRRASRRPTKCHTVITGSPTAALPVHHLLPPPRAGDLRSWQVAWRDTGR